MATGKAQKIDNTLLQVAQSLMGRHRYDAIFAACLPGEHQLRALIDSIKASTHSLLSLGNTTVIDESVIEHFSKMAQDLGILQFFEGKPHDYGLVDYVAVQRTLWTRLPIAIDFEPKLPTNKPTPHQVFLRLAQRIHQVVGPQHHCIADSAFGPNKNIKELLVAKMGVTSISANGSLTGLQTLVEFGATDLKVGKSRTFFNGTTFVQILRKVDKVTAVASSAWKCEHAIPTVPPNFV